MDANRRGDVSFRPSTGHLINSVRKLKQVLKLEEGYSPTFAETALAQAVPAQAVPERAQAMPASLIGMRLKSRWGGVHGGKEYECTVKSFRSAGSRFQHLMKYEELEEWEEEDEQWEVTLKRQVYVCA